MMLAVTMVVVYVYTTHANHSQHVLIQAFPLFISHAHHDHVLLG